MKRFLTCGRAGWFGLMALLAATALANTSNAAGLLVADGGFGGALEIKQHDARVTINNGVAVTEVEQVFLNKENRIVEALYTFPVPKNASVSNFSMWINGKEMIGEVVEKQRARQIYESYKQTKRDPGLLEQVDYKRFEMRVFPIAAGAEQRVKITYYQQLDFDHDRANYVYPLATLTRRSVDEKTTGRFSFSLDLKSETPIVGLSSPSHADQFVIVKHADAHYLQASLEATGADLGRDLVVSCSFERPHTGVDLITSKEPGEDGYFMLTVTAGKELENQMKGSDYVFVVDISGSMVHDGKLALSRGAVEAFVQSLSEQDRFEVITFNIAANPLFNAPTAASAESKTRAADFLRSQKAMGGTILAPAIEAAYRYYDADRKLNVVVLSDGMTQQGEQAELLRLISKRPSGSSVFCVGVGNEVNRPLLDQLATETGGLAAFLSANDNFEQQAEAFRRKLTRPAATNVQVRFDGAAVYDQEPQTLPSLYYGQPIRVYGRYKGQGPARVQLSAEVLGSPLNQTTDVILPEKDTSNPEIERMWAWGRVNRLMAGGRRDGSQGNVPEIVRLCEGYSIASEYASFIVLENDGEYQRWKIDRRNATRMTRDRAAQTAVRDRLEELRKQTAASIGPRPADKPASPASQKQPVELARQDVAGPAPSPATDAYVPSQQIATPQGGGSSGGGGAIDPVTALVTAGLVGVGWACRKRKEET